MALTFPRPLLSVDVIIFSILNNELVLLLTRRPAAGDEPFPGQPCLPGGFIDIDRDEDLEACARRKLLEKTGVATPYLEQLASFGSATRDPRGWTATVAYFALLPLPAGVGADVSWRPVANLPPLAFDHGLLCQRALERLRAKGEYSSLPAFLLPEPFTLPQLQQVYEIVLGRPLDKSAFRKRMLDRDFLDEVGLQPSSGVRPAMGYRIRQRQLDFFSQTFRPKEP